MARLRRLEGARAFQLPADRSRSSPRTATRARFTAKLERETAASLQAIAGRADCSPAFVALAAFDVLLHRLSGQTDERVEPEASFVELIGRVREASLEGRMDAASLERPASSQELEAHRSPPAAVFFQYRDDGTASPAGAGTDRASWELGFAVFCDEEGSRIDVDHDGELFLESTVRRWVGHYSRILEAVAVDDALPVGQIPLLSPSERDALIRRQRETCDGAPPRTPVIELFEQQARRTPHALAVSDAVGTLSYRALDRAANTLARRLSEAGARPGQRVAVILERSHAVVVSLLAVLKIGAAYVPIDPRYPPERIAYVLDDAEPTALITEASIRGRVPSPGNLPLIVLNPALLAAGEAEPSEPTRGDPESTAYVLYTSGSTGRPKGVEVTNAALTNFLTAMQRVPGLSAEDRLLSVTTISFDIAGLEIFLPLVTGASVHVVPSDVAADGARLARLVESSSATVIQATPATFRMLLDAGFRGGPKLKILCGGERMSRELAEQLRSRSGALFNMYGPTETTIWSTVHRVESGEGPVPIGTPIDHTPVYVLDARLEPVPYGVSGEIYIGGAGVARGYLNRPELTQARFVDDPFVDGGARMYRTGDLGVMRADGTLFCQGRVDDQVKVRGHRIELGEIEAVIADHPGIARVVVQARELLPGDVRLVGYVVPRGAPVATRELRDACQRRLPREMVPAHWVELSSIPLTPNGKVDRKALPLPAFETSAFGDERIEPRDALESELLRIWEAILQVRVTSVRDNFFDLGGHSLLATRLFARIERATGVALPLSTLVEGHTIEHLATKIRERRRPAEPTMAALDPGGSAPSSFAFLVPIRRNGPHPPLFCVHGAGGNVLNLCEVARYLSPDRPFYGFQSAGVDGVMRPRETIEAMATEYLEELRRACPHGPYNLGGYCGGGIIAYEMAQRLRAEGEAVPLLLLIDLQCPLLELATSPEFGWRHELAERDFRALLRRTRAKVERDSSLIAQTLQVRYHLARGHTMPYHLRDFWLTGCFLRAMEPYVLRPYAGGITVFRARETNPQFAEPDADLGWAPLAQGGVAAHEVPGDHHSITHEPHVQTLAAQIDACLRAAENPSSTRAPRSIPKQA